MYRLKNSNDMNQIFSFFQGHIYIRNFSPHIRKMTKMILTRKSNPQAKNLVEKNILKEQKNFFFQVEVKAIYQIFIKDKWPIVFCIRVSLNRYRVKH